MLIIWRPVGSVGYRVRLFGSGSVPGARWPGPVGCRVSKKWAGSGPGTKSSTRAGHYPALVSGQGKIFCPDIFFVNNCLREIFRLIILIWWEIEVDVLVHWSMPISRLNVVTTIYIFFIGTYIIHLYAKVYICRSRN